MGVDCRSLASRWVAGVAGRHGAGDRRTGPPRPVAAAVAPAVGVPNLAAPRGAGRSPRHGVADLSGAGSRDARVVRIDRLWRRAGSFVRVGSSRGLEGVAAMATRQNGTVDAPTDSTVAARRSAALVAAVTAFVVPPWFIATLAVVGTYKDNYMPGVDAPDRDFVQFYVDNFSKIPLTSTHVHHRLGPDPGRPGRPRPCPHPTADAAGDPGDHVRRRLHRGQRRQPGAVHLPDDRVRDDRRAGSPPTSTRRSHASSCCRPKASRTPAVCSSGWPC